MATLKSNSTHVMHRAATLMLVLTLVAASVLCCCFNATGEAMAASPTDMVMTVHGDHGDQASHADHDPSSHEHSDTCLDSDCDGCVSGDVFVKASAEAPSLNKSDTADHVGLAAQQHLNVASLSERLAAIHPRRGPPSFAPITLVALNVLLLV
jgi:hypothetical protein